MKSNPLHRLLNRYGFLALVGAACLSTWGLSACNRNDSSTSVDTGEGRLPPTPAGLDIAYDTLNGTVRVSWSPVKSQDLDGYVIYRYESSASEPVRVNANLVRDTFFVDTLFRNLHDPRNLQVSYRIKAQDENANLSLEFSKSVSVSAPSPTKVRTFFDLSVRNTKGDSASPGDVITFIAGYSNATRAQAAISWTVEGESIPRRTTAISGRSGLDSLKIAWPDTGFRRLIVIAEDAAGSVWNESVTVRVVMDKPRAAIFGAASVKVGIPVNLEGEATQDFGGIVQYKWDDGKEPGWDDSSAAMSQAAFTYQATGSFPVRLYVRDDDGNADSTQFMVSVSNDNPIILSGVKDTTISVNDTIVFRISATDPDGIKSYLWDFNGDGVFDDTTATPTNTHAYPANPLALNLVVTVLDNFGGSTERRAKVTVVKDAPAASITGGSKTKVGVPTAFSAAVSQKFGSIAIYKWDDGKEPGWDDSGAVMSSKVFTYLAKGSYTVRLLVRDDDGNVDSTHMALAVSNDNPIILSGVKDTTISVNDSIVFRISATDPDGIKSYLWDFNGDGIFDDTTTTPTISHAYPATPIALNLLVSVIDNFGGWTEQRAKVTIIRDEPVAVIVGPDKVGTGDRFYLRTTGSTPGKFGRIVKYEWSIGTLNDFTVASGMDTLIEAPAFESAFDTAAFMVALRITDDDGNTSTSTKSILNNRQWQLVGNAGFSGRDSRYISLAVGSGIPYVAYQDLRNSGKITVMRYTGASWAAVGSPLIPTSGVFHTSLVISGGVPYLAYSDPGNGNRVTVMRFDGGSWVPVGISGLTAGSVWKSSLAASASGTLYIAYGNSVKRFDGTNWVPVGDPFSIGSLGYTSMAFDSDAPYVAGTSNGQATVLRFDGTEWVTVGGTGFSAPGSATYTSLSISAGEPYVAYRDQENGYGATVMRFDGTEWVPVGKPGFSNDIVDYLSLAFRGSTPYVAYALDLAVKRFNGKDWVTAGNPPISGGKGWHVCLVSEDGKLYIAYQDEMNGDRTTVQVFK